MTSIAQSASMIPTPEASGVGMADPFRDRMLLLSTHALYWEADAAGHVTLIESLQLLGDVLKSRIGQPLWALHALTLSVSELAGWQAAFSRNQPFRDRELALLQPDGSLIWLSFHGLPRSTNSPCGFSGIAIDISAQKQTFQFHVSQHALFDQLTKLVPGMLFQLRKSTKGWFSFPYASAAITELFDVPVELAKGDAGPVFAKILPVDYVRCRAALEESERTLSMWNQTYRVADDAGQIRWHAASATPCRESDGSVVWYGYTSDTTDKVESEAMMQRAFEQLRSRTNLMNTALESLSHGVMMVSSQGHITYYNQRLLELLDIPDSFLARQPTLQQLILWKQDRGHLATDAPPRVLACWGHTNDDATSTFPLTCSLTTHSERTLEVKSRQLESGGWVRMFSDITEHVSARAALERSESHLRALFDAIPDRVWLKNTSGEFIMCNQATAAAFGLPMELIVGHREQDLAIAKPFTHLDTDVRALNSHAPVMFEQHMPVSHGATAQGVFEIVKRAVFDFHGSPIGVLGMARDVTERKHAEAQIERLAFYDPLTGLCNRRLFHDRLEQAQAASTRSQQWGAVCFIDLDNFKDLNDTQGHDQGDHLLRQVGQRLQLTVREQDTVARLGGDEFVVLLEDLGPEEAQAALYANTVGEKLLEALTQPYELIRGQHHNTPSIGITLFKDHIERIEDVLKRADLAMYQAKSAGRNTVRFFDPHMQEAVQRRSELARELREALGNNELLLYSQPVVNGLGTVTGHEALLRWQHPTKGMVSPGEFIPVAEQTGLILPIGDWVLRTACHCLVRWANHPTRSTWTLAVNLSARQLKDADFVSKVRAILKDTGANAALLRLELTESLLLHDAEDTVIKMTELARDGIRFSLDDFGTGYSSLSYLKTLPLSVLKIDQSFVRDLLTDPNDALIAHTILQLAESLGLDVVAEGVETDGQRQLLQVMGCKSFQGYLFGRPQPI